MPDPVTPAPAVADAQRYCVADGMLRIALAELARGAREIGGNNMGPWVRKYTGGREGARWPWCAAFVTWCYRRACTELELQPALAERFSSSRLYREAEARGLLTTTPAPGCIFLVRGGPTGFRHTGIVRAVGAGYVRTVEGNARAAEKPGVDAVCSRRRAVKGLVFIVPGVE